MRYSTAAHAAVVLAVAAVSFCGGVYYAVSGRPLPAFATQFISQANLTTGEVLAHDGTSITLRLENGATKQIPVDEFTSIGYVSSYSALSISDVPLGASANVYTADGVALQIHILTPPPAPEAI